MGFYVSQSDLEAVWGVDNIAEWSNLENADPPITATARIATAISWAEGYFNLRMRGGRYVVPVSSSDAGDSQVIKDIVARYAGRWLFQSRGITSRGEISDKILAVAAFADEIVDKLCSDEVRFGSATAVDGDTPEAPVVV
jgi:hypothetical protein